MRYSIDFVQIATTKESIEDLEYKKVVSLTNERLKVGH